MKYKLTDETMMFGGHTLHRIECVTSFNDVKAGDKGGWIEKEDNLSKEGYAWVKGNAKVYGDALVNGNAQVYGNACVFEKARVFGNARIYDNSYVYGNVWIANNVRVFGNAHIYGNVSVYDNVQVSGSACVHGDAYLSGDAIIENTTDYITIKNNWTSNRTFTWTRSNNMWRVGCFYGTGKELIKKAYKDSELSGKCYEAAVKFVESVNKAMKKSLWDRIKCHLR